MRASEAPRPATPLRPSQITISSPSSGIKNKIRRTSGEDACMACQNRRGTPLHPLQVADNKPSRPSDWRSLILDSFCTHPDRPSSSHSAGCAKCKPWRPQLGSFCVQCPPRDLLITIRGVMASWVVDSVKIRSRVVWGVGSPIRSFARPPGPARNRQSRWKTTKIDRKSMHPVDGPPLARRWLRS